MPLDTLPQVDARVADRRRGSGRRSGERRVYEVAVEFDQRRAARRASSERREGMRGHLRRAILTLQRLRISSSLSPREAERVHDALRHLWFVLREVEFPQA